MTPFPHDIDPVVVTARRALLDTLDALSDHLDNVIVVGAQAIHLRISAGVSPLAEFTKDSDLAIDPRDLAASPLLRDAMGAKRFRLDDESGQPGAWKSASDVAVDLMIPDGLVAGASRRSGGPPPHAKHALRRTAGLEAAVVDRDRLPIRALDDDPRMIVAWVAGPAALLVAKLFKVGERLDDPASRPSRIHDKDAHDAYRVLAGTSTAALADGVRTLQNDVVSAESVARALTWLDRYFADPGRRGAIMAATAEGAFTDVDATAQAVAFLSRDLLDAIS